MASVFQNMLGVEDEPNGLKGILNQWTKLERPNQLSNTVQPASTKTIAKPFVPIKVNNQSLPQPQLKDNSYFKNLKLEEMVDLDANNKMKGFGEWYKEKTDNSVILDGLNQIAAFAKLAGINLPSPIEVKNGGYRQFVNPTKNIFPYLDDETLEYHLRTKIIPKLSKDTPIRVVNDFTGDKLSGDRGEGNIVTSRLYEGMKYGNNKDYNPYYSKDSTALYFPDSVPMNNYIDTGRYSAVAERLNDSLFNTYGVDKWRIIGSAFADKYPGYVGNDSEMNKQKNQIAKDGGFPFVTYIPGDTINIRQNQPYNTVYHGKKRLPNDIIKALLALKISNMQRKEKD